jgi:hypothetical protein
MHVKKYIEEIQGKDSYSWGHQLLVFNGKCLKDESTLEENKVKEDDFLVVMISKVGCIYHPYSMCSSKLFRNLSCLTEGWRFFLSDLVRYICCKIYSCK